MSANIYDPNEKKLVPYAGKPMVEPVELSDLGDTMLSSVSDGDALVFDDAVGKWVNQEVVKNSDPRLSDARPASDVSAWAKSSTKPSYNKSEVGLGNVGNFKAVSTESGQELTDQEKANARANIGIDIIFVSS